MPYNPNQPRDPKGTPEGGQWTEYPSSDVSKIEINRIEKTFKGTHLSSNVESLEKGFEERPLGISIARNSSEEMSAPRLDEPIGTYARVYVIVSGRGLDYTNELHRRFIDTVLVQVGPPYDVNAIKYFRSVGIDWIDGWGGIGPARELHVLNPEVIKIIRIEKIQKSNHKDFLKIRF